MVGQEPGDVKACPGVAPFTEPRTAGLGARVDSLSRMMRLVWAKTKKWPQAETRRKGGPHS